MKFTHEKQGGCFCAKEIFEQLCSFLIGRSRGRGTEEYLILFSLLVDDMQEQEKKQEFILKNGRNKFVNVLSKA